jgi:hypothetical protein
VTKPVVAIASPDASTAILWFVFTSIGRMRRSVAADSQRALRVA